MLVLKLMIWKVYSMVEGSFSELWDNKDKLVEALDFFQMMKIYQNKNDKL